VQLVGAICVSESEGPRILTAPGPVLFVTGLVFAPGGLLGLVIEEKLLCEQLADDPVGDEVG
jgi:hypothetical protein